MGSNCHKFEKNKTSDAILTTAVAILTEFPGEEVEKVTVKTGRQGDVLPLGSPCPALVQGNTGSNQAGVEKRCEFWQWIKKHQFT